MASQQQRKSSWPELVGVAGEEAVETIHRENPAVKAVVVVDGDPETQDFRPNRVRVKVDRSGIVTHAPVVYGQSTRGPVDSGMTIV